MLSRGNTIKAGLKGEKLLRTAVDKFGKITLNLSSVTEIL